MKQTILSIGLIASFSTLFSQNLIKNGDCELPTVNGKIPDWIEVQGDNWHPSDANGYAQSGQYYFFPASVSTAELMQDIDVTDYACAIDLSRQKFEFTGYTHSFDQLITDKSRIYVEYRAANNTILSTYDSGNRGTASSWYTCSDTRIAPIGTRKIRIRLVSTRWTGNENDGYYDNLSLTPNPALLKIDTLKNTAATCNRANGTAQISVSGGLKPLKFKLDTLTASTDSILRNLSVGNHFVVVTDANNCTTSMSFSILSTPAPKLLTVKTTPSVCDLNNGSLTITAQKGTGFMTYQLSNQAIRNQPKFDSLSSGNYLLTIRDSIGCSDTSTIKIIEKSRPVIDSVNIVPANCNKNNGQIILFGHGETPNIQYSLDSVRFVSTNLFANLKDSTYRIIIRDTNKCTTSKNIVLKRLAPPKFDSIITKPSSCARDNGSILVSAQNVTCSIDSILFNQTMQFQNLRSGNYTIYIRDSGNCVVSQKTVVPKILPPNIDDIKILPESCKKNDGQIIVKASSSASSLNYALDSNFAKRDSFLHLSSGIFTVYVKDSFGCIINQNVTIKNQAVPLIEDIKTTPSVCDGATGVILIKAKGGRDLFFAIDSAHFQTDYLFRNVKAGKYTVIIKDAADCRATVETEVARDCGLYIPNTFSPNEDGNNDFFTFFGDDSKVDKVLDFKVFNRWGILLYNDITVQMNNINNGWDGKFRGREVESGIYVYYLKVQLKDGTTMDAKGDVTLLR